MKTSQDDGIRLSICIPTYNFGAFIGETLESIMPQVVDGVEVVILDGGSTDNTPAVVGEFQRTYPSLRYHRLAQRGGIDRDLAKTVALARGEYCWIFCSDDLMRPDAIRRMLTNISSGHDIYICGLTLCTRDMQRLMDQPILGQKTEGDFDLGDDGDRRVYFEDAETTVAFFSFAGSLIVGRARWESVPLNDAFVGSCWAHVARILELIPSGLRLRYLSSSYLWKRMGNDSFMDRGIVHRYGISIDGYHRIARTFFGEDSREARSIRRVIVNEYPPWTLLSAKMSVSHREGGTEEVRALDTLAREAYRDPSLRNWIYRLIYRWTPLTLYRVVRRGYREFGLSPWTRGVRGDRS